MKDIGKPPADYKKLEEKWQKFWLSKKIFKFNPNSKKPTYSIDTPPPTISGQLHIGHFLNYTGFDFIARCKRMCGYNVFLPIGFDDNGQPTERFVENKLGINSKDMQKAKFNKIVEKEIKPVQEEAVKNLVSWGMSYDWDTLYNTSSEYCIKTAQKSFLDLYKKGLVYRAEEPTIWCTECQTALSNADVEDVQRETKLNFIDFKLVGGGEIKISTTRPELLPACVGILIHPSDKNAKKLVGKKALVPIFEHEVPILKDKSVDPKFGTGLVMVCTFGDSADIEWWHKYKLPLRMVITKDGRLNKECGIYSGLELAKARKKILLDLKKSLTSQESLKQSVGTCWRCSTPVEFKVTKQWFINILDNKKEFIEQGKKVRWHPGFFVVRHTDWIKNLNRNWLISRQRHFGPSIPVWYCNHCGYEILPDEKDLPINPEVTKPKKSCKCGHSHFTPDRDVFDTWMTSSLTPQITTGWSENSDIFTKLFPMDLRPNGHDIIRTWDFYTIVKAFYHNKRLPWKDVMVNGMVLDPKGRPMHKSKGNIIDPKEMREKYNSDTLRYWVSSVNWGDDIPFQEKEFVRGVKLLNKLWNTTRFVFMNLKSVPIKKPTKLEIEDSWILSRLANVFDSYCQHLDGYQPSKARRDLEKFFILEFCDFYLEMIKSRIYGSDESSKYSAQWTSYNVLYSILQMFAPILCHITEELYNNLYKQDKKVQSIHVTEFEKVGKKNLGAEKLGKFGCELISELRQWKQKKNINLGETVDKITITHPNPKDVKKISDVISRTMRIKNLKIKQGKFSIRI